jgi:hypothetical protein
MSRQAMYNPGLFSVRQEPSNARKEARIQETEENDGHQEKGRREEDSDA